MTSDDELLRRYAEAGSDDAFAELVRRHLDLVYSAALRQVNGDVPLAQDVAQTVFSDLARKAASVSSRQTLTGWLYTSAYFAANKAVRTEQRRHMHEQEADSMRELLLDSEPELDWTRLRPALDAVMHQLNEADREAILLRFFENRQLAEVGERFGLSEDAARKRVDRALDKLRDHFAQRGITTTAAALSVVIATNAVQAAPVGFAATISAAALLAGAVAHTSSAIAATTTIAMTTLQKTLIAATLAVIAGAGIYEAHQTATLREENKSLQQQMAQLKTESESLSNRGPAVAEAKSLPDDQFNELLRLRGEVGVLRQQTNELGALLARQRNAPPPGPNPAADRQPASALPDDYPKTPDGATKGIFEAWSRGDWDSFFTKFGEPGVPREFYDRIFGPYTNALAGMQVVSLGEPTNSFSPDMWWVPYTVQFADGSRRTMQLHVAQDPRTQRWYFKGGF